MKKTETNKTEAHERLLIYKDDDLLKHNRKVLEEIFSEVDKIKTLFNSLEVSWNQQQFIRLINEGTGFVTDYLFSKLSENYKGLSETVIQSLTEVEKGKLQKLVLPIDPIILKVKELLKEIDLTADQLSFNVLADPIINEKLKQILIEKSKRYAVGKDEIEFVHTVEEFIAIANRLEACLTKNSYPLLFTKYFSVHAPLRYADTDSAFFPICLVNYDNIETDGCAQLQLNPDLFQELASNINAIEDFRQNAGLSKEVRDDQNLKIPVAPALRLPRDTGKKIEAGIKTLSKDRWKGFPGIK